MLPYKKTLKPIKTENKCGLLYFDNLWDQFDTKRIFYISDIDDLDETNNTRGKHINYDCNEILVVQKGLITVNLKKDDQSYTFDCKKNDYIYIPKYYYLEIIIKSKDTCYFVLCDNIR